MKLKISFWAMCAVLALPYLSACSDNQSSPPVFSGEKGLERVQDAAGQFQREDKVAVIVGMSNYPERSGLRALRYADDDAEALSKTLKGMGYSVQTLVNEDAIKDYILAAIGEAGKLLEPEQGTLLFAFSGHGFAQRGENYLAVNGTVAGNIARSGLSVSSLKQAMLDAGARRRMLFIDACRNAPSDEKSGLSPGFVLDQDAEGVNVLYSTKSGEVSFENDRLQRGVFSHFLQKGLQGEAALSNGVITFDTLANYVQRQTKKWTFEQLSRAQVPYRAGESTGVFVLGAVEGVAIPELEPEKSKLVAETPAPVLSRLKPEDPYQPLQLAERLSFEPETVLIKGGTFQMGCVSGKDCEDNEKPVRDVSIESFYMGKYEVTFDEWDACVEAKGCSHKPDDEGWGRGKRPVINVSWDDAQEYVQWLSQETGKAYRLPSEAEWEYAARAGTDTQYPWGNEIDCNLANYGSGFYSNECKEYPDRGRTVLVGSFKAYGGLYDMQGNVEEWVQDCYHESYKNSPIDGKAWEINCYKDDDGSIPAVFRGGSWGFVSVGLRSAYRFWDPRQAFQQCGFSYCQDTLIFFLFSFTL